MTVPTYQTTVILEFIRFILELQQVLISIVTKDIIGGMYVLSKYDLNFLF